MSTRKAPPAPTLASIVNGMASVDADVVRTYGIAKDPVIEANRQLLLERSNFGIEKYGVTLARSHLSIAALHRHALEEALDFANYLQAADAEMVQVLAAITAMLDATDAQHSRMSDELASARNECINMLRKHGNGYRGPHDSPAPDHHPV